MFFLSGEAETHDRPAAVIGVEGMDALGHSGEAPGFLCQAQWSLIWLWVKTEWVPFWGWLPPHYSLFKRLFGCSPGYRGFDPLPYCFFSGSRFECFFVYCRLQSKMVLSYFICRVFGSLLLFANFNRWLSRIVTCHVFPKSCMWYYTVMAVGQNELLTVAFWG